MDARTAEEAITIAEAHDGAKSMKLCFLGAKDKMVSFGFNKQSQRQLKAFSFPFRLPFIQLLSF